MRESNYVICWIEIYPLDIALLTTTAGPEYYFLAHLLPQSTHSRHYASYAPCVKQRVVLKTMLLLATRNMMLI